jgi:hypothetical protein
VIENLKNVEIMRRKVEKKERKQNTKETSILDFLKDA